MSQYVPKSYEPFGGDINVTVDLSNYATKTDIKIISYVDTSSFALESNVASLETEVDKLDIDKLKILPTNLSNLKNKVDKLDIVKLVTAPVDLSKLKQNKTKHLVVENEFKKLETFDSSYFGGKSHFENDGTENFFVF